MARTPASTAGPVNAGQRGTARVGEVGLEHRPVEVVGVHARALAQGVLQILDQGADVAGACTPSPRGKSPDMSMIPAPVTPVTPRQTSHSRTEVRAPPSSSAPSASWASWARIRSRRRPLMAGARKLAG